jgi:tetratricopeptide (TPR) repeat protein
VNDNPLIRHRILFKPFTDKSLKISLEELSMHRKYFFISCVAMAVLLMTSMAASAQMKRLTGQVMIKQADGKTAPATDATVDLYRTDKPQQKETKTDKKGKFTFVAETAGDYVLSISAPNAQPRIISSVRVREEDYQITLEPGDGRRLAKQEVLGGSAGGAGGTAEGADSAKKSELARKNAELEAKNKKVEESNAIVIRTFKAGNEALKAKRYDEAITLYNEGLAADPEQASLLTNKSVALRERGVERYRAAKDEAAREAAKKDFRDALEAATKAIDLVKAEAAPADATAKNQQDLRRRLALFARAEVMRRFVPLVDKSQIDAGVTAYDELIAVLTDPAQKLEAQLAVARMLFDAGVSDKAAAAYSKILETNPDNVDAALYAGLALYGTGDTAKYQEAANYLQRFVDKAPDTHAMKASAKEALENLKQQNVTPKKSTAGRRRE